MWCNLFHVADLLDYDFAKMLRHMYEMVENHSIFLEGWNYITTAELDCATLPAMVFFAMTGNVYLAYGLANIFDIVLWIFVTQLLFDTIDLFIICLGFLSFRRFKRFVDESKVDEKISCMEKAEIMLIAIFFWNFVIVMLTDLADRYHLIGTVPIRICGVINTGQILSRCNNRIRNLPLAIAFLSLFLVLIYNDSE